MLFVGLFPLRARQPPDQLSKKQEGLRSFRHACWDRALGQHARLQLAEGVQSRVMRFPSLCHYPLDEIGNYPQHGHKDWLRHILRRKAGSGTVRAALLASRS